MYDLLKEPVEIRLGKAKLKKTNAKTLDVLSRDSFWFVRNFVAAHPNSSYETLQFLLNDVDHRVRFEAEKNLKSRGLNEQIATAKENIREQNKHTTKELVR